MFGQLFSQRNELEWRLLPNKHPENSKENHTGKVYLPEMCLEELCAKQMQMPYIFRISSHGGISYTHAGVQEFTTEQQYIILPEWMYEQLALDSSPIDVAYVSLPKGRFIKLLPQSRDFLDIENPKIELEKSLRNYQVLSAGDTISLYFESEFKNIMFTVTEIDPPGEGISIVDTDLEVDFLPPADYAVPSPVSAKSLIAATERGIYLRDPDHPDRSVLGVLFGAEEAGFQAPSTPKAEEAE